MSSSLKRVLVVGAGNTGCDIAVEAAQQGRAAWHSTRRGYWYAPKYAFGKPADQINALVSGVRTPMWLKQRLMHATIRTTVGDHAKRGLPRPDHAILETHPIANSLLPYYVGQGDITPVPDVERFDGDRVVLTDGTELTGWIEWYDKNCIKLNRSDAPNLLLFKHSIKFMFKEEELRHDQVRHVVFDRADDEDEAVLQQPRVDVVCPLSPRRLLDDHRYEIQCLCAHVSSCQRCL